MGKQTERANQIINEVGIPSLVDEYSDIVSKGEMLNDEQSDTAVVAIEQLQKSRAVRSMACWYPSHRLCTSSVWR